MSDPKERETPVVATFLGVQALGDFVICHLVAASVARAVGGRLVAVYRDDRPYKDFVTRLNPWVAKTVRTPDNPATVVPLDWFDGRAPNLGPDFNAPDILLVPSMMDIGRMIPPTPRFNIPADATPNLEARLRTSGVDPTCWFVCLHMREAGYEFRRVRETARNTDPISYMLAIEAILAAGGQVVRLGDASMTPLPDLPGLVDLARGDADFELQAFATSRARFFLGTDSGPVYLAGALHTPAAMTNGLGTCVFNPGDLSLIKTLHTAEGEILDGERARLVHAVSTELRARDMGFLDNDPETLVAAAELMLERTLDCPGWRSAGPAEAVDAGSVELPLAWRDVTQEAGVTFWPGKPTTG